MTTTPEISAVQSDPCASYWLRGALESAIGRDPVDAARDAEALCRLLAGRAKAALNGHPVPRRTFAERLKDERKRLHMTQAECAMELEICPRALWSWEDGKEPPPVAQEGALARLGRLSRNA